MDPFVRFGIAFNELQNCVHVLSKNKRIGPYDDSDMAESRVVAG